MSETSPSPRPITITIDQASKRSGIPVASIYVLLKSGALPSVKVLRRRLIDFDAFEALLKGGRSIREPMQLDPRR